MNDAIQYAMACLLTHSYFLQSGMWKEKSFADRFCLSDSEHDELQYFIRRVSHRLMSHAKLMEEKRWREMERFLKYTRRFLAPRAFWQSYLSSLSLTTLPETPLLEAICFLEYLLTVRLFSAIESGVIRYELNLLKASLLTTDQLFMKPFLQRTTCCRADANRIMMNASIFLDVFDFKISKYITTCDALRKTLYFMLPDIEEVCFYQRFSKSSVRAIVLNSAERAFLKHCLRYPSSICCVHCLQESWSCSERSINRAISFLCQHELARLF